MPRLRRELSQRERDLLDFEREWMRHKGAKQAVIRDRFGFSPARYYQLLAKLVYEPAALDYDPMTVRRIRRRRQERERRRTARAAGARPPR